MARNECAKDICAGRRGQDERSGEVRIVLSLIIFVVMLVAIPLFALGRVMHLFRTRNDKCANGGEEARPWSSRLYSATKRAALAWAAEMLFCVVVYFGMGVGWYDIRWLPRHYDVWVMVAVPVAAFAWGCVMPRIYMDGMERVRNGRRSAWFELAVLLFPVSMVVSLLSRQMAPVVHRGMGGAERVIEIRADKWDSWRFRMVDVAPDMIPWGATDIEIVYQPCNLLGLGGRATIRCKVDRDNLLAFAKNRGFEFQSESIERNACTDGCGDCNFVGQVWHKYNGNAEYPSDFLAYNFRIATCGGYSFLYDVENETLYGEWSSN